MAGKPLQTLHRALLDNNYDVPEDYASFERTLSASGNQGYQNRHTLWKSLRDGGFDVPDNYESFSRTLFAPAKQQKQPQPTQPWWNGDPGYQNDNPAAKAVKKQPQTPNQMAQQPVSQPLPPSQPMQLPEGFGELNIDQAKKGSLGWNQPGIVNPQTGKMQPKQEKNIAKQVDKAIKGDAKAAKEIGLDTALQRKREELDYSEATGQALGEGNRYAPWEAPTVARDENGQIQYGENGQPITGITTDEQRVSQYRQQKKDAIRKEIINSAVDKVQKQMEQEALGKLSDSMKDDGLAPELQVGKVYGGVTQYLQDSSPEELLNRLNKAYGYEDASDSAEKDEDLRKQGKSTVLAHWDDKKGLDFANKFLEENRDAIEEAAGELGMTVDDYVFDELMPNLANNIAERFQQNMSDKYSVKDTADYLTRKMSNSIIGTLATMGATTKKTRQFMQEELQKSEEGQGNNFNANGWNKAAGTTLFFAADALPLMIGGAIGKYTAKGIGEGIKALGYKSLGAMVEGGSNFLAANVGKAIKYGGAAVGNVARGVGAMGTFMGASSAVQDMSVGDGTLSSIGHAALEGFWEGAKFGAATGLFSVGAGSLGSKIGKVGEKGMSLAAKRAAFSGAAFLVENQIFAGLDYISDPENFNWAESSEDAFYMQIASKITGLSHENERGNVGIKKIADNFINLFSEKKAKPVQLTDVDKESIQRAFGGMDFVDIAKDYNNIGKILGDKENIPWVTRQKVSGYTFNTFEPSRPRTSDIHTNEAEKTISERADNGELIEVHKYNDADELQEIRQQIEERRANDDMLADFGKLSAIKVAEPTQESISFAAKELLEANPNLRPQDVEPGGKSYDVVLDRAKEKANWGREIVAKFAEDYGMSVEEVLDIMHKKPIDRVDDEQDLMTELSARLHEAAYPTGEKHTEQSRIDGETLAGDGGEMNPETATMIAQEVEAARNAYLSAPKSEEVQQAIDALGQDARLDDIYVSIRDNYSGPEVDNFLEKLADYANARAKQEGFIEKTGRNIDEQVAQDVDEKSFHGLIDGQSDSDNIITISKDGEQYILVNGNIGTMPDELTVNPDISSNLIILRSQDGRFVPTKPDALMTIQGREPKDAYANRVREQLQIKASDVAIGTGLVEVPKEEVADVKEENNNVEEPAPIEATSEQLINPSSPEGEAAQEPVVDVESVKDKDGIKRYEQGIPVDNAIADIQNDGFDVNEVADASIAEAQAAIDKINKKDVKTRKDLVDRKKAQDVIDYYNNVKERYNEAANPESELNVESKENNETPNDLTLQPKVASEHKKNPNADEKRAERIKELKQQYGKHFDDDFTKAQSAEELASMYVGRNRTLSREDLAKELGYGLGLGTDEVWAETLLAKKGQGKTLQDVAHAAWESDENPTVDAEGNKMFSVDEIYNALIDVFRNSKKKSDILDYAINSREAIARREMEAEQRKNEELKESGELEPVNLTDEEVAELEKNFPFPMSTGEEIPDAPITKLKKESEALMSEEGTPEISIVDSDRITDEMWRSMAEKASGGAFLGEEEIEQFKKDILEGKVYYNEETGKITVFSSDLTPEELREAVETIKQYIKNDRVRRQEREEKEDLVTARDSSYAEGEKASERAGEAEGRESDAESQGRSESDIDDRQRREYDEYIKPLLERSDEELQQLKKKKEDAVGGDLTKLAGDKEYSGIVNVLAQRELDQGRKDAKIFIENTIDDEDVTFVDKATQKEIDELNRLINEHGVDDSEGKIEDYVKRLRKKYPADNSNPIEAIEKAANEFKEEKKEQARQLGITFDETPEQKAESEGDVIINDEAPLTEEEIDSSSLSDVQKTWAKAYLKGLSDNELYTEAYLEAYEDVRNRRQDNEANRSDAGSGAQLAGSDDSQVSELGGTGTPVGGVDAGGDVSSQGSNRPGSGGVQRVEDSKDNVPSTDGERGDNSVSGSEPRLDGLSSGGEQPTRSSDAGSGGHNVPRPGSDRQGNVLADQSGERDIKTKRQELKSKRDELLAKLKELKEQEKKDNQGKLQMAILPPAPSGISSYIPKDKEQRKVFWELATTTAEYGYTYLEEGVTKFKEWKEKVYKDFVEPIKDFFGWGQNEVDRYIEQVWNSDYNINGVTRTMSEWASFIGEKELKKVVAADRSTKFEQQKAAESVETKVGDIDNIRESLPYLLPEQQDDVYKAETQFFNEQHQDREHGYGKGMMFTNGTGTGKTYTGLGIVKRFVKQGKGRVLILTPSQEKVSDWRKDGLNLGLNIESLDEEAKLKGTSATKAKGKGVVVTTYANARQNLAMLEDCFDLIVYDESHKIMESKEASNTTMMDFHEMLTNKNVERSMDRQTYWLPEWIEYRNLVKEREDTTTKLDELNKKGSLDQEEQEMQDRLNARMMEIAKRMEELRPIMQEIRESKRPQAEIDSKRTKTVFLSATPFNVRESLRYTEGYLFSFPEEDKSTIGTYNHRSPQDAFFEQMFPAGYRWRYGRLEQHVANADALSRQEIDFSDYLQNTLHTMSGRMILSDYDYSRDFPVMTLDHAGRFNQAMSEVYRNRAYQPLAESFRKAFDYNYSTALFEAMKTSLVNERIKEHLDRGQKVVVFHRRRTSGDLEPPFRRALNMAEAEAEVCEQNGDTDGKNKILSAVAAFERDFQDMLEWEKTIDYSLPREQIERRFGKDKVAFFSGAETKKTKHQSVEDFMKDNGGKDIIVIQEASGKEGISLHDQTGEHQRVEINLALPQSPIAFIQIEGRIYRIGQKSNAIFEYPLLGLDLETNLFAQKFNSALGTTENLALGSKARNLRKSIANSVLENTGEVDYDRQGYGGKDMDGRVSDTGDKDGFDIAIQDYYGNQKMSRGRDNREGVDYFPTPEPIGYKMVEFAQMTDGETALEPSAGHGAIARYVPEANAMTAIEPSAGLFTKLQMRAGGPGRRFEEMNFEDYPLANKHDAIIMNPPYGVGGKTAMEHVAKAFRHLNEGGRIVAIIPDGPAMEKRLDAWLSSEDLKGAAVVVGEVRLPDVAFGRAGTNVRTRMVVIDKVTRPKMRESVPQKVSVDLSNKNTVEELFDGIRNVRMPERTIDQVAINEKRAKRTERQFKDNPFVTSNYVGERPYSSGSVLVAGTRAGGDQIDLNIDLGDLDIDYIIDKYAKLKKYRENPEELDYGKWKTRSFGSGKNKVPALDAIRDYCDAAIKTLENLSRMTADQMDKAAKEREKENARRIAEIQEQMRKREEERMKAREQNMQKIAEAQNVFDSEFHEKDKYDKEYIKSLIEKSHYSGWAAERAKEVLKRYGVDWETGRRIKNSEPANKTTETVAQAETPQAPERKTDYEYVLDKNTRTGDDMHLVKYNGSRLSDADYKATERKAKANGGYYNRFKKAFHFDTEADARKFAESMNGTTTEEGATTRFRLREKEEPKKTQKVYKLMRLGDDGKLYPLFIDSAAPTELGKWYDADSPDVKNLEGLESGFAYKIDREGNVVETKPVNRTKTTITGLPNVQKINDATNEECRWITVTTDKKGAKTYHNVGINGSGQPGTFAMRPGWHAGSLPSMRQIGKGKDKNLRDDRFVWVEGEVPADVDYQEEANGNPFKDIPTHIPEDGFYMKATNANKEASQADRIGWYVAGAFKANRIMSDREARKVIDDWNEEHPDRKVEYDFERESGKEFNAETMRLEDRDTYNIGEYRNRKTLPGMPDDVEAWVTNKSGRKIALLHKTEEGYLAEAPDYSYLTEPYPTEKEAIDALRQAAISEMQPEDSPMTRFSKRKSPETVVPGGGSPFKATAVSSEDGAKVIKDLENLVKKTENLSIRGRNTFIGDVADALGAENKGSRSKYAKFETLNGTEILIRLSDHNASTLNFDHNGERNGISIVISRKPNKGITNDGDAHVVEFFYSNKELKKAEGNPYAKIVESIRQALNSGEYKDTTGLAKREEVNETVEEVETRLRKFDKEQIPVEADYARKEEAGRKLAKKLNSDFEAITDVSQIKNKEVRDAIDAGKEVPGWIEIDKDGKKKVYMYLPHVKDTYDAEKTIAHEVIGHQGMRELLGEKAYKSYMRSLLLDLKNEELQKYWMDNLAKNGFDTYRTIDEFLAEAAEKGYGDLPMWQKVKNAFTDALRSAGFTMSPSISDVKYMVWLSKHNMEEGNIMDKVKREALLYRLGKERYEAKVRNGEFTYDNPKEGEVYVPYFPGEGKTLFRQAPSIKNQRLNYERALKRLGYVWKEAHVDQMQAAIELMRSISGVKKIEDIPSAENFVLMENQMSSKEEQIDYLFNRDYMKPLDDAVAEILPDMTSKNVDEQLRDLQLYMIKKHGLERNRVLYVRDAIRALRKDPSVDQHQVDAMEQDYLDTMRGLRDDLRNGTIDLKEYFEDVDNWIKSYLPEYEVGKKDYSGLTDIYGKGFNDADIVDDVMSVEDMLGNERVNNLWEKTKTVSQFGLDMEYEGGIDSKEKHDKVSEMFEWYVPLRGYEEKTAEDVYDYLEEHGNERKWAGPVLMNAKGRESLADVDVFATLGAMSSSAINRALRNQMKQSFARFVRNHYNDVDADKRLVTELPYIWAEKQYDPTTGNEVWVEKFPDIPENAKADDIAQILEQYQQDMEAKQATGDAKRVRQNSHIPFRPVSNEHKSQHIVDVWINGEKHAFIVNGNPRAAQAINGQLKAEGATNAAAKFVRTMAQLNTSYSPDFIVGNTERDFIFALTAAGVKESPKYLGKWIKNYGVATGRVAAGVPVVGTNLFNRYRKGELNMANPTDRYFKEFMENGGETGWVETKNLDKWKKEIKKGVKTQSTPEKVGKWILNAIPDGVEAMNERAENLARFTTYMTSRQMGRSITRSVSDAKEISVNFNRKGSGKKVKDFANGESALKKINAIAAARTAQFGQDYFMFYNAGVQGLNNASKMFRDHPVKASTAAAIFALGGILMPQLNQALIEDEDEKKRGVKDPYAELPEWIRRNRLCIYTGDGEFATIDLPIELRALYGIGDMAAGYTQHPELRNDKPVWEDLMTQMTQILPIDFLGEHPNQPLLNFVPSTVVPFAEAAANVNWYGRPIEKESYGNDDKPRWTRAYQSTNKFYMWLSKQLNAATNQYSKEELEKLGVPSESTNEADQGIRGVADGWLTDPSLMEHIVNGYFGGVGQTVGRIGHVVNMLKEGSSLNETLSSDKMPVLRRLHYSPTDQNKMARTRNKWYKYKEEMNKVKTEINTMKSYGAEDPLAKMKQISLEDSNRASRMEMMQDSLKAYNKQKKIADNPKSNEDEKEAARMRMDQIMQNTVVALDSLQQTR